MMFLKLIKIRLMCLILKRLSYLKKIRFLKSKHHSLLEKNNVLTQEIKNNQSSSFINQNFHPRTKVFNEILDKCKTHIDKRGLGYINKEETPFSGETMFFKGKNDL